MTPKDAELVKCQMMIRKPIAEVYQAFIDPEITTQFWFTKSSGKLIEGRRIKWEWEMYGVSTEVEVSEIIENQKISIIWGKPPTMVDFEFEKLTEHQTYVIINHYGFSQTGDELMAEIRDNTGGFTTVLDGLKAYLEHGIKLNLVVDKFPQKAN